MRSEDIHKYVFDKKFLKKLDAKAEKIFDDPALAIEATTFVINKLEENDWKKPKKCKDESKFDRCINRMSSNLIIDFLRKVRGYKRPPKWIKELGNLWVNIYQLLCFNKNTETDVIETYFHEDIDQIESIINEILAKDSHCGEENYINVLYDDEKRADSHTENVLKNYQEQNVLNQIFRIILDDSIEEIKIPDHKAIQKCIEKFKSNISLDDQQRIFLKLIFEDGYKIVKAGKKVKWNKNQADGQYRRLMNQFRNALELSGLGDILMGLIK